jgi:hypothetical protein
MGQPCEFQVRSGRQERLAAPAPPRRAAAELSPPNRSSAPRAVSSAGELSPRLQATKVAVDESVIKC